MSQLKTLLPRTTSFYGESLADLELMPTTTKLGEGEYPRILASEGAIAQILTQDELTIYMLRSSGWVELTMPGGGGGTSEVTGVRGALEQEYRKHNVTLALDNIIDTSEDFTYDDNDKSLKLNKLTNAQMSALKNLL